MPRGFSSIESAAEIRGLAKAEPFGFGGLARLTALAFLALAGVWPAFGLDEGISGPFNLPGDETAVLALFDQIQPDLACDSSGARISLAVWEDHRTGEADIFAARFDSSGTNLDPLGIPIAISAATETTPAVCFGSNDFLVVWATQETSAWEIRGVRMSPEGERLDVQLLTIASSRLEMRDPAVGFDGTNWFVAWSDDRGDKAEIYGTAVTGDGIVLQPNGVRIAGGTGDLISPAVSYGAGEYLISWMDQFIRISASDTTETSNVGGILVDPAGEPSTTPFSLAHTDLIEADPSAAFDGNEFLAVWTHRRDAGVAFVFGRRVTTDGSVAADSIEVGRLIGHQESGNRYAPAAMFNGENLMVTWSVTTMQGIFGARVELTDTTAVVSSQIEFSTAPATKQAAVWNGSRYVFAYSFRGAADSDIGCTFADATGLELSGGGPLSNSTPAQIAISMAFDGNDYLVTWEEQCDWGWCARGARVSPAGEVLHDFALFETLSDAHRQPQILYGGGAYLLAWNDVGAIWARLIDADGGALSGDVLVSSFFGAEFQAAPACAWNGSQFMISWRIAGAILGTRLFVDESGLQIFDTYPLVFQEGTDFTDPALIASGANFLGAWSEADTLSGMEFDSTVAVTELCRASDPGTPTMAMLGSLGQVMWEDGAGPLYGIRMNQDGSAVEPGRYLLSPRAGAGDRPGLFSDGYTGLAFWREPDNGVWALKGARLGSDGAIATPGVFTVADERAMQRYPVASAGPLGQGCVVYSALVLDGGLSSLRLFGKLWSAQPPEMIIAVHQNPALPSNISIYAFPSEPLDPTSVKLYANGAPLEVIESDEEHGIFRGVYDARETAAVNIVAEGLDLAGNFGRATRAFTVGLLDPLTPATIVSPDGIIALALPAGAVSQPSCLLLLPDISWGASDSPAEAVWQFDISPSVQLDKPIALSMNLPENWRPANTVTGLDRGSASNSGFALMLEQRTASGWKPVPSVPANGGLSASISELGTFRARWATASDVTAGRLQLRQGPEPFRATLGIRYFLPAAGHVSLAIFDANGRRVRDLVSGTAEAGWHDAAWDGLDGSGRRAESGVYFTRLTLGTDTIARRSVYMR